MADYNPRVKLSVDVSDAVNNLNGVLESAKQLKSEIEGGNGLKVKVDGVENVEKHLKSISGDIAKIKTSLKDLNKIDVFDTKSAEKALDVLAKRVDATKNSVKNDPADLSKAINIDGLGSALNRVTTELKTALDEALKKLGDRIETATRDTAQLMDVFADQRAVSNLQEMSRRLGEMENKITELNSKHIQFADENSKQNVEAITEKLQDVKENLLQMEAVKFDITDENAKTKAEGLLEILEKIRQTVQDISAHPIDVNVTNEGFNQMIENFNRASGVLDGIIKKTATLARKQQEENQAAEEFTRIAGDSAEGMRLIAEYTESADRAERRFGMAANEAAESNDRIAQIALRVSALQIQAADAKRKEAEEAKKLAKDERLYERTMAKANNNLAKGQRYYQRISSESGRAKNNVEKLSSVMLKTFYSARGVAEIFQQMQGFAYNISSYIQNIGSQLMGTVVPAAKDLLSQGFEFASNLENSRISYKLFFPNEDPDEIFETITQRAIENPVFDTSDLSKYVAQLAPLSGGNSQLVIDAVEGIAAMIKASGGDVSTYMQKLVTNTQQIVSTGKATVRDWNEFLRATPVFEKVLSEVTPALRAKLNDETAEITKDDTKQLLKALQLVRTDSSIADVLEQTAKNFDSLVQQTKESIQTTMGKLAISSGLYDQVKELLQENDRLGKLLNKYAGPIMADIAKLISTIDLDEIEAMIQDIVQIIKTTINEILQIYGFDTSNFNTTSLRKLITGVVQFIMDFVKGFATGIKTVIDFVQWAMQQMNLDTSQVGIILGWLASPGGMMISRLLNALTGFTQLFANLWSSAKAIGDFITQGKTIQGLIESLKTSTAAAKLGTILADAMCGLILAAAGYAADKLAISVGTQLGSTATGGIIGGVANTALSAAGGAILGGSIAGAPGAIIGGVGGGIWGLISSINNYTEEIAKNTASAEDLLRSEYEKTIEAAVGGLSDTFIDGFNQLMGNQGRSDLKVDTMSDAGYYARQRLAEYFANTDPGKYNSAEAAKVLSNAYLYKRSAEYLDKYTETEAFRKNTGGGTFDMENDTERRNNLANLIAYFRLNGDYFDYGSDNEHRRVDSILKTYLGENKTYSNNQIDSLITEMEMKRYETETKTDQATALSKNSEVLTECTRAAEESTKTLVSEFSEYGKKQDELIQSITELKQSIDGTDDWLSIDAFGNITKHSPESNAYSPTIKSDTATINTVGGVEIKGSGTDALNKNMQNSPGWGTSLFGNKFYGGLISMPKVKPVYKQSGGALGVDTVPVMAQRGEFIVRRSVVEKIGLPAMTALNLGDTKLAASLMGRPNISNANRTNINNDNDNRRYIRQIVKVVNRNHSSSLNSAYSLANRLALR